MTRSPVNRTMTTGQLCEHVASLSEVTAGSDGCEECLAMGATWVHLRICMECGHVGCCNDSVNKHATRHFLSTGHPVMQSFEPGEDWMWCFVDEIFV